MKPSGFRSYDSAWRVHVAPRWGAKRIADIRYSEVQAWVAELSRRRGAAIVQTAYSVLARILDDAVRDRLLASNPARGVKLPKRAPPRNWSGWPSSPGATARLCCCWVSVACAGVRPPRCMCATWTFCAAVSSCTATPSW